MTLAESRSRARRQCRASGIRVTVILAKPSICNTFGTLPKPTYLSEVILLVVALAQTWIVQLKVMSFGVA